MDMPALAAWITAGAVLTSAVMAVVFAITQRKIVAKLDQLPPAIEPILPAIEEVREAVKPPNRQIMDRLAELAEGRRIEKDIPKDERTEQEQQAVDNLDETAADPNAK